ncbi:MAG: FHA domain-containing protein [Planctomycetes bacterium]|nr:FHA domain-containing protein [Planctomycetota bacterium]MCW8134811.1 FHA domain-containing protein [Planctomycetota bacterium]
MVDIDVVTPVQANGKADPAAIKASIKAGRFEKKAGAKAKPAVDLTEKAPEIAPEPSEITPEAQPQKAQRPPEKATKAEVGYLVDVESGSRHQIKEKLVIGREAPSDLVFQIPTISKRHFHINRQGGGFVIEDLRSTNGTYLNGLPVHEPVPLRDGDEIVVAITLKHPKGARVFQFTTKSD